MALAVTLEKKGGTDKTYPGLENRFLQGVHYESNAGIKPYAKAVTPFRST